jgi:hypothetical protein
MLQPLACSAAAATGQPAVATETGTVRRTASALLRAQRGRSDRGEAAAAAAGTHGRVRSKLRHAAASAAEQAYTPQVSPSAGGRVVWTFMRTSHHAIRTERNGRRAAPRRVVVCAGWTAALSCGR